MQSSDIRWDCKKADSAEYTIPVTASTTPGTMAVMLTVDLRALPRASSAEWTRCMSARNTGTRQATRPTLPIQKAASGSVPRRMEMIVGAAYTQSAERLTT
mmetsp:Transcript_11739/g.26814  ORF Transcript_11739/g.26814 Transcript_11739/m.26814 type:complete len:101 (-) Transcript_11739:101-403(-)